MFSETQNTTLYYFWGSGCTHCAKAAPFVEKLHEKYPQLTIKKYEVWYFPENAKLFERFAKGYNLTVVGTPTFFIGEKAIVGWESEAKTGRDLEEAVVYCLENKCADPLEIINQEKKQDEQITPDAEKEPLVIDIPLIGKIDLTSSPLIILSLMLGFLDGFNPCAMWVLIYLISMVVLERDRNKMIIIVGTFLLVTAVFYYLILAAWLNIFLILPYMNETRLIIGAVAVYFGLTGLYKYYKEGPACSVVDPKQRKKIIDTIKSLGTLSGIAVILTVAFLAVSVNTIEFICSAGFPALFTRILAESQLSFWEYQLYLLAYLFMFMLDDIIVFTLSVYLLSAFKEAGEKYAGVSHLIGSLLMLLLGLVLIFFPQILIIPTG